MTEVFWDVDLSSLASCSIAGVPLDCRMHFQPTKVCSSSTCRPCRAVCTVCCVLLRSQLPAMQAPRTTLLLLGRTTWCAGCHERRRRAAVSHALLARAATGWRPPRAAAHRCESGERRILRTAGRRSVHVPL
jgi:hypothetical protein